MICGNRTFIPELGQHRFCTLMIGLRTNPNHDMPNAENKIVPHRSGEWTWATEYPEIGPDMESGAFWSEDHEFFWEDQVVQEMIDSPVKILNPNYEA